MDDRADDTGRIAGGELPGAAAVPEHSAGRASSQGQKRHTCHRLRRMPRRTHGTFHFKLASLIRKRASKLSVPSRIRSCPGTSSAMVAAFTSRIFAISLAPLFISDRCRAAAAAFGNPARTVCLRIERLALEIRLVNIIAVRNGQAANSGPHEDLAHHRAQARRSRRVAPARARAFSAPRLRSRRRGSVWNISYPKSHLHSRILRLQSSVRKIQ